MPPFDLKQKLKNNYQLRQIYSLCANTLHCLPSDIYDKSELEINIMLAELSLEADEINERNAR